MKSYQLIRLYLMCLLFSMGLLQAEGFAAGTLVATSRGFLSIEQVVVGDCVIVDGNSELSADFVTHTMNDSFDVAIKINLGDDCIYAVPDQKMYELSRRDWISADQLMQSDQLLCINGGSITIDEINVVRKTQKMYALSVERNHVFCVGRYGVVAHNIEPAMTTAAVAALSVLCSLAAVFAIGEVAALLAVGLGTYCIYRKTQKDKEKLKFFRDDSYAADQNNGDGCFSSDGPVLPVIACYPPADVSVERVQDRTVIVENLTKNDVMLTDEVQ